MDVVSVERQALTQAFDELLQPTQFRDYGPNGLQVEGREQVGLLVSGVTASLALIEAAIEARADAVVVHHGLFWRGQDGRVTGWMKQRLARLLAHDINLYAYHLPLDAHPVLGNNAQWAQRLGLTWLDGPEHRFGEQSLGLVASCKPIRLQAWMEHVRGVMGREVVCIGDPDREVHKVALCSGGAQGYFEAAMAAGADVFLSGEISEPQAHLARECGVAFMACGHHASERYGAPALADAVARQLGIQHRFIDIPNPA